MRRNISNICLLLLPVIYLLFYEMYLFNHFMKYIEFITAAFMIVLLFLSVYLLGFKNNKHNTIMNNIKSLVITYVVTFFAISYGGGLFFGFLENAYSLKFFSIIDNTFAVIVTLICTELFRYNFIRANKDKLGIIKIMTAVLTIFEILISIKLSSLTGFSSIFKITTSVALPIVMKNITLSYLSYQVGYQTTLIYRLLMDIYIYIAPIIPDLGEYINSVLGVGLPFLIYIKSSKIIDEFNNGVEHDFQEKKFGPNDYVIIGIIGCIILMISGILPWYVIGIATDSMNPQILKGDAVVVKKVKIPEELKPGVVVTYFKDEKEIVHRLIEVSEEEGKVCYITKGDANPTADPGCITFEDIKGIVKTKIPYIAYPKIYLSELLD